ncbi:MAG TPA: CLEC16A/gop-1 family protein, partial [archaeon]|nr:CLEC16A/gop-1 family protein [archaeon]
WVSTIWKRPPNRFRVEYLRELWESLEKCSAIHSGNQAVVIERLRELAELLIWGDQHDGAFFEFFLEHNIFDYIVRLFCNASVSPEVRVQLLQTLSILVENTSRDLSLYYMFSNDKINELITFPMFVPDDPHEELRAYYISFLKTLSLKLTPSTLQFFFNTQTLDFPLFTEAVRYFDSPDPMVRVSVRSLVLNIYRVDDEQMLAHVHHTASPPFFRALAAAISAKIRSLDAMVADLGAPQPPRKPYSEVEALLEELVDLFYFINDVCELRRLPLRAHLADCLLRDPLALLHESVVPPQDAPRRIPTASTSSSLSSSTSSYASGSLPLQQQPLSPSVPLAAAAAASLAESVDSAA